MTLDPATDPGPVPDCDTCSDDPFGTVNRHRLDTVSRLTDLLDSSDSGYLTTTDLSAIVDARDLLADDAKLAELLDLARALARGMDQLGNMTAGLMDSPAGKALGKAFGLG